MTFDEWLDIAQESAESELGENVMMLTPEEAVNIYKLVRVQRAALQDAQAALSDCATYKTADAAELGLDFYEAHQTTIAALEAALMGQSDSDP